MHGQEAPMETVNPSRTSSMAGQNHMQRVEIERDQFQGLASKIDVKDATVDDSTPIFT